MSDIVTMQEEKEELLAQLAKLEKKQRDAGAKNVTKSDTSQGDWRGIVMRAVQRVDPEAAGDPKLAVWVDTDRFGGSRPQRALMIRRFVHGDYYTGKAPLPQHMLRNPAALENAIRVALDELKTNAMNSYGRLDALTAAERKVAEERHARKKLEVRLEKLEAMLAASVPAETPSIAGALVAELKSEEPPVDAPSETEEPSAAEADGLPKAAGKKRGRPRKAASQP